MDRVRRRIQSSGNCRRTFPGLCCRFTRLLFCTAPPHSITTPPSLLPLLPLPTPPIFAFKRDCSVLLDDAVHFLTWTSIVGTDHSILIKIGIMLIFWLNMASRLNRCRRVYLYFWVENVILCIIGKRRNIKILCTRKKIFFLRFFSMENVFEINFLKVLILIKSVSR